ncbi:MAG: class I SAM-dependent methyltransferase [Candidatus Sumerlaeia bacterium]|nr:class I SAM-dependent methyltransferase [Candidatus Sumerlaeia bacterium]
MTSLADLPHDAARRFAALVGIAGAFDHATPVRFLDVGGYPGTLARLLQERFPAWSGLTVDTVPEQRPGYQCADGARLPFDAASFDIVFSSDALEHIAPEHRDAFLAECRRVARRAVVLGAPFRHEATAGIEHALDDVHRLATGRPHPWLGEHVTNGLPDLAATCGVLGGDWSVALFASAPLTDWTLWQWLSLAREVRGELDPAWSRLEAARAQRLGSDAAPDWQSAEQTHAWPYRWIVVAQHPDHRVFAPSSEMPPACAADAGAEALAWSDLLRGCVEGLVASGAQASGLAVALDEQARRALELAENEIAALRAARPASGIARLFGRGGGR